MAGMANYLSIRQVAMKLRVSKQWVHYLIEHGRIKAKKIGSYYVVNETSLSKITPKESGITPRSKLIYL